MRGQVSGGARMSEPFPGEQEHEADEVVRLLTEVRMTVAVAESLTGGLLVAALIAVPGASRCVRGGVVAYATDLKATLLDVPRGLLEEHGAVHADVALAMARGVRERLGADYGIATTGVAGPDPQDAQPPGTFHVAVHGPAGGQAVSASPLGESTREQVRVAARDAALSLLLRRCRADLAARPRGASPA